MTCDSSRHGLPWIRDWVRTLDVVGEKAASGLLQRRQPLKTPPVTMLSMPTAIVLGVGILLLALAYWVARPQPRRSGGPYATGAARSAPRAKPSPGSAAQPMREATQPKRDAAQPK